MNPWPFVIAAYVIVALTTLWITLASWRAMKTAERAVEEL